MNNPIRITDLHSLRREKERLLILQEDNKRKLEQRYTHFKYNYKSILWNAINPFNGKSPFLSKVAFIAKEVILPFILSGDEKTTVSESELIGLVVSKIVDKFKRKSKKEPESSTN